MSEKETDIRQDLLDFVNTIDDEDDEGPDMHMVACNIDVTGSLGVWGIN